MKFNCKDCQKRKVGCHSTCQQYIVQKVIRQYKNQKSTMKFEYTYDERAYERRTEKLRNKLSGYGAR